MKKFFAIAALAVMTLTANAQVFVGGQLGAWRDYDANTTSVSVLPEVGYTLSDKFAIGTVIGWKYNYVQGTKANSLTVAPYARYTFAQFGNVNLFLDGGFGFDTYKVSGADAANAWEIGIKPGVAVNLTDKLSFVSHFGFLGYRDADAGAKAFGKNGFGFNADANNITFGLYYNF